MNDGGAIKLVSLCIPVHNRTHDLKYIFPYLLDAANASPPVEIVIVNYNSPDDLEQFIKGTFSIRIGDGTSLRYRKYTERNYYHMAHARNLAITLSTGDYLVTSSTDIYFSPDFVPTIREMMAKGYDFLHGNKYKGVICCKRDVMIAAGGYDERFEFYSPEDTDLERRLLRRGCKLGIFDDGMIDIIPTSNEDKIKNYRLAISKAEMAKQMHEILYENDEKQILVANEGREWGVWSTCAPM